MAIFSLASEFPPVSREDWLAKVARSSQASRASTRLRSTSDDGIIIEPLYEGGAAGTNASSGQHRTAAGSSRSGSIIRSPSVANELALDDLRGGATGLALTFSGAASARGFGLAGDDATQIAGALRNVDMHAVADQARARTARRARTALPCGSCARRAASIRKPIRLSFGIDPIGLLATLGSKLATPWQEARPAGEPTRRRAGNRIYRAIHGGRRQALS